MNPQELEGLQRKKNELENELHSMEGKEEALNSRVKMLQEKVAVHELERKVKAKRNAINQLESKVKTLEERFKAPHDKPKEPSPQQGKERQPEPKKEDIVVMEPNLAPEGTLEPEQQEQKKKRRFF